MTTFTWYQFKELTREQLYALLALRASVFVVDQHCPYLDPDGKDQRAMHLLGIEQDALVAYLRLFPPRENENFIIFGRIVTAKTARQKGWGKALMSQLLSYCNQHYSGIPIQCSAQYYLKQFYESFGFKAISDIYQEDGIPHIAMEKKP